MREIKFKAFHKSSKKIFDVYSFTDTEVIENSTDGIFTSDTLPALREECELLQYTELKDCTKFEELSEQEQQFWLIKNKKEDWKGKEIYEGDIVEIIFNEDYIDNNDYIEIEEGSIKKGLIIFYDGGFFFKLKNKKFFLFLYDICSVDIEIKILGNIYQNSELLERKE